MIPIKTQVNEANRIAVQKIFLANRIAPLAIHRDENEKDCYKVLFKLDENVTGKFIFFEVKFRAEDQLDKSYIESKSIYIDNIKKDENKFKAFKEIMKDFTVELFYVGDFDMIRNNMNYTVNGFKTISPDQKNIYFELMKIYIPRYMYIIVSLYLQELLDPYTDMEKEFLFVSNDVINLKFDRVENVKLVASTKKQLENGTYLYSTMYNFYSGPSSWKFTYEIITPEDLELKEPLFTSTYEAEYSKYNDRFIGNVADRGFVYIILKDDNNKVIALSVSNELISKTNIVDPYYIFTDENNSKAQEMGDMKCVE